MELIKTLKYYIYIKTFEIDLNQGKLIMNLPKY